MRMVSVTAFLVLLGAAIKLKSLSPLIRSFFGLMRFGDLILNVLFFWFVPACYCPFICYFETTESSCLDEFVSLGLSRRGETDY